MTLQTDTIRRAGIVILGLLFLTGAVLIVAYPVLAPGANLALAVNQVVPKSITAPISITYESQVLTRLARENAANAVSRIYDPPNPAVLREQVRQARDLLDYIAGVRSSDEKPLAVRLAELESNLLLATLDPARLNALLSLEEASWETIDSQTISTLERVMRNEIREDNVRAVLNTLPNSVSINVSEAEADLIVAMVGALILPNTFYNEARTEAARVSAAEAVRPVTRSFIQGQVVVREGTLVSEADLEALTTLGLLRPDDQRWRVMAGALLGVVIAVSLTLAFVERFEPALLKDGARMALTAVLLLAFLAGSRAVTGESTFLQAVYPAAAFTLIVAAFVDVKIAAGLTLTLAALTGIALDNSLETAFLTASGGIVGLLTLRSENQGSGYNSINSYFVAGALIGGVNVAVGLLFDLTQSTFDPSSALGAVPLGLLGGGLSAGLGLVGLYLVSRMLNLPTSVKLLELSQPNQPLLQRLLREAPGTYQHSLQVANLGELAAERICANAALVRVGALYHDIGKLSAPLFFVENQAEGVNPHNALPFAESARIIINHVVEGARLGRKHHLPAVIVDFILEHHGTTRAIYFYNKALEAAGGDESKVDAALYTYPGPCPQTREAAILMLADASETIIRSRRARDKQEIASIVEELVQARLSCGQLEDSHLTIKDLHTIKEVFVASLQGVFHPRIAYPPAPKGMTQEINAAIAGETRP